MIYFLFSMAGLAAGLLIVAKEIYWTNNLWLNRFADFSKNYQPKPMRDKKGKFTSPLKQKQAVIHAALEREVAAKKGRLL